jgi:hypothetical protein
MPTVVAGDFFPGLIPVVLRCADLQDVAPGLGAKLEFFKNGLQIALKIVPPGSKRKIQFKNQSCYSQQKNLRSRSPSERFKT